MPQQLHSSWFDHLNRICWGAQIKSFSLCSLLHSAVISSLLCPNNFLRTQLLQTLCTCFSLSVTDQVPPQYKTTGKIIDVHVSITEYTHDNTNIYDPFISDLRMLSVVRSNTVSTDRVLTVGSCKVWALVVVVVVQVGRLPRHHYLHCPAPSSTQTTKRKMQSQQMQIVKRNKTDYNWQPLRHV